jgi:hypothetical protein
MPVSGILATGAPVSIHYRGGMARDGEDFFREINGAEGDIRVLGHFGRTQMVQLSLKGAGGDEKAFQPLEVPASYRTSRSARRRLHLRIAKGRGQLSDTAFPN